MPQADPHMEMRLVVGPGALPQACGLAAAITLRLWCLIHGRGLTLKPARFLDQVLHSRDLAESTRKQWTDVGRRGQGQHRCLGLRAHKESQSHTHQAGRASVHGGEKIKPGRGQ